MKRLLFCVGALIITHCASGMEGRNSRKGYTEIPSPQEKKHPYCWTNSCANDNHDDAQTLRNLGNIQEPQNLASSVFVEVMLEDNQSHLMARDTKVCEISKDSDGTSNQPSSVPAQANNKDSQKPAINIRDVAFSQDSATIEYYLHTGKEGSTQTASVKFDQTDKRPLANGLIVTISALIASSKPDGTRK